MTSASTCSASSVNATKNTSRNGHTGMFIADWPLRSFARR